MLETAGEVHATFYRLPSRGLGPSPLTPEQADSLAARLASFGHFLLYVRSRFRVTSGPFHGEQTGAPSTAAGPEPEE